MMMIQKNKKKLSDSQIKKSFQAEAASFTAALRAKIEANATGLSSSDAAIAERRITAYGSFKFFLQTYFPHYVKNTPATLHEYLFVEFQKALDNGVGDHYAIAAPRGHAKSTMITQIGTLWAIITGRKKYVVIVMDALDQALPMLEAIKAELEFNQMLLMDFPEVCGQGKVWQYATIVTNNNAKVEVFGSNKKIRGRRHGPHRPDLVIGDDLENDENVAKPEQRDKLESFVNKSLLSLGPADDSLDVFIIGTILHYDSVLARLMANPLWKSKKFQAVERFPDDMHIWDKWQEVLLNDGEEEALKFYRENPGMDHGAVICWPGGTTFYKLMVKRARDGQSAFDSELQNDPISEDNAPFATCIHFWVNRLPDWVFGGSVDPSLGKAAKSSRKPDPSAVLVGGFNRETRVLNVVEASIKIRKPSKIILDVIEFQQQYRCFYWAVEAVQFQAFFADVMLNESLLAGVPVPVVQVTPNTDKQLRIQAIQPFCRNKNILLHPSLVELIKQLRHFPMADHDDGPDALEMLWSQFWMITASSGKVLHGKKKRHAASLLEGY